MHRVYPVIFLKINTVAKTNDVRNEEYCAPCQSFTLVGFIGKTAQHNKGIIKSAKTKTCAEFSKSNTTCLIVYTVIAMAAMTMTRLTSHCMEAPVAWALGSEPMGAGATPGLVHRIPAEAGLIPVWADPILVTPRANLSLRTLAMDTKPHCPPVDCHRVMAQAALVRDIVLDLVLPAASGI